MLMDAEQASVNSQQKITFKKMIASEDIVSDADFPGLTNDALTTIKAKQTTLISSTTVKGSNVTVTSVFTNAGIAADYMMNTIMLVAEYNGSEFLAAITVANRAYRVPMENENEHVEYTIKAQLGISNTELVNLNMDPAAIATNEQLESTKKEILTITDDQQKHLDTLDQKDAQNVKLTGNQTIKDSKTFSSPIIGNLLGNAKNADYVRGINIANNTNLLGLKDSGRFIASGAQTGVTGLPPGIGAKYEVNQFVSGTSGYRTLLDNENKAYYAMMNNSVWSPWHKFVAADLSNEFLEDATFNKDVRAKGKVITSGLELSHSTTPFIDFHYQNSPLDWTTRLIEQAPGRLDLVKTDNSIGDLYANLVGNSTTASKLQTPFKIDNIATNGTGAIYTNEVYRSAISGNIDLNTIIHPGLYSLRNVTHANNPFGGKPINGVLAVRALDDNGTQSWVHQTYFQDTGDIWFNDCGATGTPNWKRNKNAVDTLSDMQMIRQWDNLIPNSDLDGRGYGWDLGNDNVTSKVAVEGLNITPAGPDAAQFRAAIMNTAKPSSTANWGGATSNRIRLRPGSKYFYSAWVYTDGLNGDKPPLGQIGLNFYRLDGSLIGNQYERFDFVNAPAADQYNTWHRLAKFFVGPADAAYARFIFFSRQGAREYMAMPLLCDMLNRDVEPLRYVKGENPFDKMLSFFDISAGAYQDINSINRFKNNVGFYGGTSFWSEPTFNEGASFKGDINVSGKTWQGAVELVTNTPYIDFHYGSNKDLDFSTRLIEEVKGKLSLFNGDPFGKGTLIANLEGNATHADTATKLTTARKIDGVQFDGSGDISTWRKVNVGRIYSSGNPLNGGVFDIWRQGNLWYIGPWSTNVDYHITGGPEGNISLDVHYDNANEIPPNTPTALPTFLNSGSGISPECERVSATLIRFRFPENREGSDAQLRIGSCMLMG